jgi:predicted ATPase/DNA-binding CsgD family transcriptional regulator
MDEPLSSSSRASLPTPLTPLVGREREVTAISALLCRDDVRLVTLTGPGGVGKTRLALHVAAKVSADLADGARYVGLAPITDPALVSSMVAQALGVREAGNEPILARLTAFLRDRQTLLLLDNFEQVVEAAPLVADLLGACPDLKILATSRVRLRLSGEREYPVPPLGLPGKSAGDAELAESEAVRLFVERAQAVKPDFAVTDLDAPAVANICRHLDGLPLAIELAAARIKVLPPQTLLTRLERRLSLLTGGGRDLPARQQTMRDAIAWSYDLLDGEEQTFFRRLSVFAGGFTLEAAEAVATDVGELDEAILEGITSLIDKSLLRQEIGPSGEPRYSMLETVREFAAEQLAGPTGNPGDEATVRARHAAWCLALAERAEPELLSSHNRGWLALLEADHANLRAALAWGLERPGAEPTDVELGQRLAAALQRFWRIHCHFTEGRHWVEAALAKDAGAPANLRAKLLWAAGTMVHFQRDHATAGPLIERAFSLAQIAGDTTSAARILAFLGEIRLKAGEMDRARDCCEGAAVLLRDLPENPWTTFPPKNLGYLALIAGDHARAEGLFDESLAISRRIDYPWGVAEAQALLAELARERGEVGRATALFAESLGTYADQGDRIGIAQCLTGFGRIVAMQGQPARAARFFGAAAAIHDTLGSRQLHGADARDEDLLAPVRTALGDAAFDRAWTAGRALSMAQAIGEARDVAAEIVVPARSPAPKTAAVHGLTSRERDVLRLLAEGCSDREIAEALFIGPRTVQTHVANLFAKLGVNARAEAAAVAVRRGLV